MSTGDSTSNRLLDSRSDSGLEQTRAFTTGAVTLLENLGTLGSDRDFLLGDRNNWRNAQVLLLHEFLGEVTESRVQNGGLVLVVVRLPLLLASHGEALLEVILKSHGGGRAKTTNAELGLHVSHSYFYKLI